MARVSITTLGCKVNQYDGQAIAEAIESAGWHRAAEDAPEAVDLVVINTCCVTATAMSKSRQAIRRAVRRSPAAAVLVAGCYGDYDARRIAALLADLGVRPERTAVVGHHGDLAACVRSFARLLIRPRRRIDPEERSRGVRPRKLAKWRPEGKRATFPTEATSAVAVSRPTPGIVRRRVTVSICFPSASS